MTQTEKDLLLKDLCARLPYEVQMNHIADNEHSPKTLIGIAKDMITLEGLGGYEFVDVEHYKPYLFPLSSMTEEQKKEFELSFDLNYASAYSQELQMAVNMIKWLNKNHFDYNGLIDKSLAMDATGLNIY